MRSSLWPSTAHASQMRSGSGRPSSPKQSCEAQHRFGGIPLSGCPRLTPKENTHQTKAGSEVSDSLFLVKLFMLGSLHSRWVVRSHRHHRARPLSFNATLEAMRHHHSTVTLLTFRSPPPTTVRRRHRPVRFRRRPIEASVTVFLVAKGDGPFSTHRELHRRKLHRSS